MGRRAAVRRRGTRRLAGAGQAGGGQGSGDLRCIVLVLGGFIFASDEVKSVIEGSGQGAEAEAAMDDDEERSRSAATGSCFDLERRLHKIDRWRVPLPYGLPLRSLGYFVAGTVRRDRGRRGCRSSARRSWASCTPRSASCCCRSRSRTRSQLEDRRAHARTRRHSPGCGCTRGRGGSRPSARPSPVGTSGARPGDPRARRAVERGCARAVDHRSGADHPPLPDPDARRAEDPAPQRRTGTEPMWRGKQINLRSESARWSIE